MKTGNRQFVQVSYTFFEKRKDLSPKAIVLYMALKECESRFCNADRDYFYRTDSDLQEDAGLSYPTLYKAKKELKDAGLIESWTQKYEFSNGDMSDYKVTCYRIP